MPKRGRPNKEIVRDKQITFKVTQNEFDAIERTSKLSGLSVSSFVRLIVLRFLGKNKDIG